MRISSLELTDYNVIGTASIDFDRCHRLTMIGGRLESAGASSNGAGKSSIFDAICWATFGKELRKRPASSMVRRGAKSARVVITYTNEGEPWIKIERVRKKSGSVELFIDDKQVSTAQGGQEQIERRLGMSFDLFTRTVMFGGALSAFCRLTPADRAKLLEEMLGIGYFLDAAEKAKAKAKELSFEHDALIAERERLLTEREESKDEFRVSVMSYADALRQQSREEAEDLRELNALFGEWNTKYKVLRNAREAASTVVDDYAERRAAWKAEIDKCDEEQERLQKPLLEASKRVNHAEAQINSLRAKLRQLEDKKHPDVCPTCQRAWPQDGSKVNTTPLHAELRMLTDTLPKYAKDVSIVETAIRLSKGKRQSLRENEPEPPKQDRAIQDALDEMADTESLIASTTQTIEHHRNSTVPDERYAIVQKTFRRLMEVSKQQDTGRKARKALGRELAMYQYWQRALGREGIPSILLESTAPALNKAVQPIAKYLTDGAIHVGFEAVASESGRFDFRVTAENMDGGESYNDLSSGERVRVDLCALLAIRSLMTERSPVRFEQLFVDEIFDHLDAAGIDAVTRLLRSKELAQQIVFISHNPALQDAADSVINVVKKDGVSRVKQV